MYADRVVKDFGVPPRTAAFIVKLYADSEGYDHSEADGAVAARWAEKFLALPAAEQQYWKHKGVERVKAIDDAYRARLTTQP